MKQEKYWYQTSKHGSNMAHYKGRHTSIQKPFHLFSIERNLMRSSIVDECHKHTWKHQAYAIREMVARGLACRDMEFEALLRSSTEYKNLQITWPIQGFVINLKALHTTASLTWVGRSDFGQAGFCGRQRCCSYSPRKSYRPGRY